MQKATHFKLLAFTLLAALALLFSSLTARAATNGTVEGTITNQETGRPLASVKVVLLAPDGSTVNRASTDTKGYYSFVGVSPGVYTVTTSIVTFQPSKATVTVTQDQTSTLNFSLEKSIRTGTTTVRVAPIPAARQAQTATANVVNAKEEQQRKSQAYDLYQYPGILIGQPGFTPDPVSGLPSIRGADINATGYQLDGVDITNPRNNYFATNLVTTGLKSANVYTAGADASYAGHTGGFVNVVTNNGRDIRGGVVEYTGPGSSNWSYAGTNTEYGNVIEGTKLDYYVSTIVFKNGFPENVFGLKKVNSYDGLYKINYYAGPGDTLTLTHTNGFERYETPGVHDSEFARGSGAVKPISVVPGSVSAANPYGLPEPVGRQDRQNQGYMLDKFDYKHNFSAKSYGTLRYYRFRSGFDVFAGPSFASDGSFVSDDDTTQGAQFDFVNQLQKTDQIKAGLLYSPSGLTYRQLLPGIRDQNFLAHTYQTRGYLTNQAKLANNKLTLDTGLVYATQKYDLVDRTLANGTTVNPSYSTSYADPRVGAAYAVRPDLVLRSNYGITSQFADAYRAQIAVAADKAGQKFDPQAPTTDAQLLTRYGPGNKLKALHSQNFDFGVEKGLVSNGGLLDGSYDAVVNVYKRHQTNQIVYERTTFIPLSGPRVYTNNGKADSSGLEFQLSKRVRRPSDWNGFASYTNQVEKNTSSLNNGYFSYYYNAFSLSPPVGFTDAQARAANRAEYPATYAQRHTVYVNANKRFSRLLEASLNLDAGSGYPYANGTSNLTGGTGIDGQHAFEGAGFAEVPIVLPNGTTLQPKTEVPGYTGWHYKISLNTNFYITQNTNLFFNVDNIFNRKTVLVYAPFDARANDFYNAPTDAYPQGTVNYGANIKNTPVQVTFGFRTKF